MAYTSQTAYDKEVEGRQSSDMEITEERTITSLILDDMDHKNVAAFPLTGGQRVVVRSYAKSPHYLPLAIITLFVNIVFGLPAVVCACLSRSRRQRGEDETASTLGKAAFWLSMVGIAVSVVIGVFAIVYIYVIIPNIIHIDINDIT